MRDGSRILEGLRQDGFRITRAREGIIDILADAGAPLGAPEIGERLEARGLGVNKTTVYRELEFLKSRGYALEVSIGDGLRRFELRPEAGSHHHHHIVCTECDFVACVEVEKCIGEDLARIGRRSNFEITEHSLKLMGICERCRG